VKTGGRWLKTGGGWSKRVVAGQNGLVVENRWWVVKTGGRWLERVVSGENG